MCRVGRVFDTQMSQIYISAKGFDLPLLQADDDSLSHMPEQ